MNERFTKEDLEAAKMKLYMVMMQHVGPDKKIGMGELYEEIFSLRWSNRINDTKVLRKLITEMRQEGTPIMSDSSSTNGGYWIAASASEINAWAERSKARALAVLGRIASIKKVSLPEYIGQMQLELGGK